MEAVAPAPASEELHVEGRQEDQAAGEGLLEAMKLVALRVGLDLQRLLAGMEGQSGEGVGVGVGPGSQAAVSCGGVGGSSGKMDTSPVDEDAMQGVEVGGRDGSAVLPVQHQSAVLPVQHQDERPAPCHRSPLSAQQPAGGEPTAAAVAGARTQAELRSVVETLQRVLTAHQPTEQYSLLCMWGRKVRGLAHAWGLPNLSLAAMLLEALRWSSELVQDVGLECGLHALVRQLLGVAARCRAAVCAAEKTADLDTNATADANGPAAAGAASAANAAAMAAILDPRLAMLDALAAEELLLSAEGSGLTRRTAVTDLPPPPDIPTE